MNSFSSGDETIPGRGEQLPRRAETQSGGAEPLPSRAEPLPSGESGLPRRDQQAGGGTGQFSQRGAPFGQPFEAFRRAEDLPQRGPSANGFDVFSHRGEQLPQRGETGSGNGAALPRRNEQPPPAESADMPQGRESLPRPEEQLPQRGGPQLPQRGEALPQRDGPQLPEPGGDGLPQRGDSLPQRNEALPNGATPPAAERSPTPARRQPSSARRQPSWRGDSLPSEASSLPQRGDSLPQRGEALPQRGDALPPRNEGLPQRGEALPQRGDSSAGTSALPRRTTRTRPAGRHRSPHRLSVASDAPALVLAVPGSAEADPTEIGPRVASIASQSCPGVDIRVGYLDGDELTLSECLMPADREESEQDQFPSVIVPLLLSPNAQFDPVLRQYAAQPPIPAVVAAHLGPHPMVAEALHSRLAEAGLARQARSAASASLPTTAASWCWPTSVRKRPARLGSRRFCWPPGCRCPLSRPHSAIRRASSTRSTG